MSKEKETPLDEQDVAIRYFTAQIAIDEEEMCKLEIVMEAVNNARANGLKVDLFINNENELCYSVEKKKRIGFDTL